MTADTVYETAIFGGMPNGDRTVYDVMLEKHCKEFKLKDLAETFFPNIMDGLNDAYDSGYNALHDQIYRNNDNEIIKDIIETYIKIEKLSSEERIKLFENNNYDDPMLYFKRYSLNDIKHLLNRSLSNQM